MKKGLNNEGFTLVELLAIMVILGILLMIAIPQVTKTITNSRKEVFVDTAIAFISSAKNAMVNQSYTQGIPIDPTYSVCIPFNQIEYEKGSNSPFGSAIDTKSSYVKVYNDNGKIKYYVFMRDKRDHYLGPIEESVFSSVDKKTDLVFNRKLFYKSEKTNFVSPFDIDNKNGNYGDAVDVIHALGKSKRTDPAGLCTYLANPNVDGLTIKWSTLEPAFEVYDIYYTDNGPALLDHTTDSTKLNLIKDIYTKSYDPSPYNSANNGYYGSQGTVDGVSPFSLYLENQLPAVLKEGVVNEDDEDLDGDE